MKVSLSGIVYELGEECYPYTAVEQFDTLIEEYNLTHIPGYWGWGNFRKTNRSVYGLLETAIAGTLQQVHIAPADIDVVIFCSAGGGEYYHVANELLGKLLEGQQLKSPLIIGQCFTGCVSIFTGIRLGTDMIKNGLYRNILVVTVDKVPGDVNRFRKFALYSDAASSFLLSADDVGDFEVLNTIVCSDPALMSGAITEQDIHFRHLTDTHKQIYHQQDISPKEIEKVFVTNLYKPLVGINMIRLGYKGQQCYFDNIERNGHCFSSDPIINLADYMKHRSTSEHEACFMLAAMATGHAGFSIIREKNTLII